MNREVEIIRLKCRLLFNHPRYQNDLLKFDKIYDQLTVKKIKPFTLIFQTLYKEQAMFFKIDYGISLPITVQELKKYLKEKDYQLLKELFFINLKHVEIIDRPITEKEKRRSSDILPGGLHSGLITLRINPVGNKKKILKEIENILVEDKKRNPPETDFIYLNKCLDTFEEFNTRKSKNKKFTYEDFAELKGDLDNLESTVTKLKREYSAAKNLIISANYLR